MRTVLGCAWRSALLTASVRDAQKLVLALGHEAVTDHRAFETADRAAFDGGAFGELAQRELEADSFGLVGTQRHHRAARIGEALAGEIRGCG